MDVIGLVHIYSAIGAVAISVAGIPQAVTMFRSRSSENVSLTMWIILTLSLGGLLARSLAIVHDPVFIAQQVASEVINVIVIAEILYFRRNDRRNDGRKDR